METKNKTSQRMVRISEIREKEVFVEVLDTGDEYRMNEMAIEAVKKMYKNGDIELNDSDLVDVEYENAVIEWE